MPRLRVVTYNIHKCKGLDGRIEPSRIAEVLRALRPDIVALQEVLSVDGGGELDQARYLARELEMGYVLGENRRLFGGAYGNAVLSRFEMRSHCNYDLTVPGRERRGCLRTDVDVPDFGVLHLFNVHLGTAYLERRAQGKRLLEEELLRSRSLNGPRIVLGDFNEWTRGLASQLLYNEFRCADIRLHLKVKATYPGVFPVLHLDHIYYDQSLVLDRVGLHRTPVSLIASDHLPIWAEFHLSVAST